MKKLFDAFQPRSKAEWLDKVKKDLKGKDIESLNWTLNRWLTFSPFAHREDCPDSYPTLRAYQQDNTWSIGAPVYVCDYPTANKTALRLLSEGANALCFILQGTPDKSELSALLKDIQLEWMHIHFQVAQESWKRLTLNFVDCIKEKGQDPANVSCSISVAGSPVSETKEIQHLREIIQLLPKGQFLSISNHALFTERDKIDKALARSLHQGNQMIQRLTAEGFSLAEIQAQFQFHLRLTDSYFLSIATLRALRLLWRQVLQAWDSSLSANVTLCVHVDPATQTDDEHYNKIKASTQAMAAVIGGADTLYIYPSDDFKNQGGTPFSQRIALNIQHLMQMESYMDRVVDPAAGSYYIENMTEQLAAEAWTIFVETES